MTVLNECNHAVTKEEITTFLFSLISNPGIREEDAFFCEEYKTVWERYLSTHEIDTLFYKQHCESAEYFPVIQYFTDYKVLIYFAIERVNNYIASEKISTTKVLLSNIIDTLHFTLCDEDDTFKAFNTKPIATIMLPSMNNGQIKELTAIDGNHRISNALRNNKDIAVTCILDYILPKDFFLSDTSYILYHIISSYYCLVGCFCPDRNFYLEHLKKSFYSS